MIENVAKRCLCADIHTFFLLDATYLLYCSFRQNCCQYNTFVLAMNKSNLGIALTIILDYAYLWLIPNIMS